jgi:hypothetical protein
VPGCRVGDWILDRARARVLMAGGAPLAAAIASCTHVLIRGLLPVVLASLCSHAMHRFRRRSRLADVVGTLAGLEVVSGVGALVRIPTRNLYAVTQHLLTRRNFLFLNSLKGFQRSLGQRAHFIFFFLLLLILII